MNKIFYSTVVHRSIISLEGDDKINFLQSIVTNDIKKAKNQYAVWAALLSPQGKFLHDFFIFLFKDKLLLTCEKEREDDLLLRLEKLKLRAKVTLKKENTLKLFVLWNPNIPSEEQEKIVIENIKNHTNLIFFPDPRLKNSGMFIISEPNSFKTSFDNNIITSKSYLDYDEFRIKLGIPDGSKDMPVEKSYILENGFKELNGIDFNKGCYIGQEVTARMHYRGLIKKRLVPTYINGSPPPAGSLLTINDKKIGVMMSSVEKNGLALVNLQEWSKLEYLDLKFEKTGIKPLIQEWINKEKIS
ncbi:MAG: hypothetical protein CBC47_00845 [Alphaproteobacteria bacterium TMED87]|nr:glycine cleavage system protein T [Rhodospirillaceae bacterium]OUV11790.1 MAG: hypothetical protein CBC47_00845 [Alphaproteobacteria bacterium TMED87]